MKTFYIIDENSNDICCLVAAKNEKSALTKYKNNSTLTTGLYNVVNENNQYKLISSYGSCFTAAICHYPDKIKQCLTLIK